MNKTTLIAILIAFTLGFGICYGVNASNSPINQEVATVASVSNVAMTMEHSMDNAVADLSDKTGDDLDLAFIESMIIHHEGAVAMAEKIVTTTKRPELKQMAENIIGTQNEEIETMNGWLSSWYGR